MFCGSAYGFKMNGNRNNAMEIDKYSINSEREQREQLNRNLLLSEILNEHKLEKKTTLTTQNTATSEGRTTTNEEAILFSIWDT